MSSSLSRWSRLALLCLKRIHTSHVSHEFDREGKGVFTDAGRFSDLHEDLRQQVFAAYPQPAGNSFIRDAIIAHARRSAAAAPPFSIAAELLRQVRMLGGDPAEGNP